MIFTQKNFTQADRPNIWERRYEMPNGNIGTITHLGPDSDYVPYSVVIHNEVPCTTSTDWWDSVVTDLGGADSIEEAEMLIREAGQVA
jgi:hypothetical protein